MKSEELREAVIAYANQTSIKECSLLFEDIVSYSTIYKWCNDSKSLSYTYTYEQCLKEYSNLKKSTPTYNTLPTRNRIVHTFQSHFFDIERNLWKDKAIRKKLLLNRQTYLQKDTFSDREILRGFKISGIHIGYSHFSPLWLKKFIIDEGVKAIYDPCGGWGHRLIGAAISNINYIYNDLWNKTYSSCNQIANFLNYKCTLYNNDCTVFTPTEDYDCVFTCPPYHNVEVYNNKTFNNLDDYNQFLNKMFYKSIKASVNKVGVVINNTYENNIINNMHESFYLTRRIILGSTDAISHLSTSKNNTKQELLLIFYRKA